MLGGKIGRQRSEPGFLEPSGFGVDKERRADLHDNAVEVGKPRRGHGYIYGTARQMSLELGFEFELRIILEAIIARQPAHQLAALPVVEDTADIFARDAGHGGEVALPDLLADDDPPGADVLAEIPGELEQSQGHPAAQR